MDPTPRCVVMPPARRPFLDPDGFQADPVPDFKDTNVNLWQAWCVRVRPHVREFHPPRGGSQLPAVAFRICMLCTAVADHTVIRRSKQCCPSKAC